MKRLSFLFAILFAIVSLAVVSFLAIGCGSNWLQDQKGAISTGEVPAEGTTPDAGNTDATPTENNNNESTSESNSADAGMAEKTSDAGQTDATSEPVSDAGNSEPQAEPSAPDAAPADQTPDTMQTDSKGGEVTQPDTSPADTMPADTTPQPPRPPSHTNRSQAYTWCAKVPKFSDHCPAVAPTDLGDPSKVRFIPHIEESNHADGSPEVRNFVVAFPNNNCPVVVAPLKNGIPKDCSGRYVNHVVFETRIYKDDGKQDINQKEVIQWILSGSKADQLLAEPCYSNQYLKPAPTGGKYVKDIDAQNTNNAHQKCFGKTLNVKKGDVPYHLLWNGRPTP